MAKEFSPTAFVVNNLIPVGLHLLAGLPKVGKSWLALWLVLTVAKGEDVWGNSTTQGTTLYLCFEDNNSRIQNRLLEITEEAPSNVHFCTEPSTFQTGLLEQIETFVEEHPDTNLVIIDTLQLAKGTSTDSSYASDYADLLPLKELSYKLNIAVILIHHLKKKEEPDKFHQISGTTGLQGVVDGMYVLTQKRGQERLVNLHCLGRDFPQRELEIIRNENNVWDLISDSLQGELNHLAKLKDTVTKFLAVEKSFQGTATELSTLLNAHSVDKFSPRTLSKNLLLCQKDLEKSGIVFSNRRSNGKRLIELKFMSDDSVDENASEVVADTVTLTALTPTPDQNTTF
ncbi:MAG: AAA family ATPase [Eubacteriales bacterium]